MRPEPDHDVEEQGVQPAAEAVSWPLDDAPPPAERTMDGGEADGGATLPVAADPEQLIADGFVPL